MIARTLALALSAIALAATPAAAQPPAPKLIIAISVDQFSADLFGEYRQHFTAGMKRLANGIVFPAGFQGHAATETCPGHSTILTGSRPSRTGIIANNWIDQSLARADKEIYCSEDADAPGSSSTNYQVSPELLKVPTLGDRMKLANPASRVVAVAGKDRAAVMMGGHTTDQMWFWGGKAFVTLPERTAQPPAIVSRINARVLSEIAQPEKAVLPALCRSRAVAVPLAGGGSVGLLPDRKAEDFRGFRTATRFDAAVADIAIGLMQDMKLGRGAAPDVLAIGLSGTDYVGHTYGTEGAEMCAQLVALDQAVGRILAAADRSGTPYAVVLTADHGGHDLPERNAARGFPDAQRIQGSVSLNAVGTAVAQEFGLPGSVLLGDAPGGDIYLDRSVPPELRSRILAAVTARLIAMPQVETVISAEELKRVPAPTHPVDEWSIAERFRASFDPTRSGDLLIALKPHVTPIADPSKGYVATHGSVWNYDRRVPILFWQPGRIGFEEPLPVETVDILPTLAALVKLPVPREEIDGRCLDLDAGAGDSCAP